MENLSPRWRNFLKNAGWYLASLIVLIAFLTFTRHPLALLILWIVGLSWGGYLAFRLSQLLFGNNEIAGVTEENLQAYLEQAQSYQTQIQTAIRTTSSKSDRSRLNQLAPQIEGWIEAVTNLVQRLNSLRQDEVIRRDLKAVPRAISNLQARLEAESDPVICQQLERTISKREEQLQALEELQNMMKRAEIQIESTLSMLGTIYSQILTGQSTNHVANYDRLSQDVNEEVRHLKDHLEALQEVKLGESNR